MKLKTFHHFFLPAIILISTLAACTSKQDYEDRINKQYTWTTLHRFVVEKNGISTATISDSSITLVYRNELSRYDFSGKLIDSDSLTDIQYIYRYYGGDSTYWVDEFPSLHHVIKKYNNKKELQTERKIETLSDIMYMGNDRFIIPDLDTTSNTYVMKFYDAHQDSVLKEINIGKLLGTKDTLSIHKGAITFTNRFSKNVSGDVLAYYRYNSSFIVIDSNFVATAYQDFRKLPVGIPSLKGHNVLLTPLNCGIENGSMDNEFIYLITPTYQCKQWQNSRFERTMDVYAKSSKKYIGSISFPLEKDTYLISFAQTSAGFVVVYSKDSETEIVIYDGKFLQLFR